MSESPASAFGKTLRRRRLVRELTQQALAEAAGLHLNYISLMERGQRTPSLDVVLKLARGLGVPASELVTEVEGMINPGDLQ